MTFKSYIENSYLKETEANIVEKEFKNNKYYLNLDRTIFYPHLSGGQLRDKGTINQIEVLDVFQDGDHIIHVVDKDINTNNVILSIDWNNRFDLMQQHSGQHLLSSCFYNLFNAETIGFHMGKDYTYIDVSKPQITEDEIGKVEFLANKIIQSNFRILSYIVSRDSLPKFSTIKVPEKHEDIRIVEIDGLDYSPCCGTHVCHTGEIGLLKIVGWERYKGNTRVKFLCGSRAIGDYNWKDSYIRKISLMFSSKDRDVLNKIKDLMQDKEDIEKENRDLRKELYQYKGELYLTESKSYDGIRYIVKELEDTSIKEINLIASNLNHEDNLIQIYSIPNAGTGQFLVSRSHDLDIDVHKILDSISEKIIVKGGGNSQMVQGSSSLILLDTLIKMFYSEVRNYFKG